MSGNISTLKLELSEKRFEAGECSNSHSEHQIERTSKVTHTLSHGGFMLQDGCSELVDSARCEVVGRNAAGQ